MWYMGIEYMVHNICPAPRLDLPNSSFVGLVVDICYRLRFIGLLCLNNYFQKLETIIWVLVEVPTV